MPWWAVPGPKVKMIRVRKSEKSPSLVPSEKEAALYLGIEGGGTRTVALLANAAGKLLLRREFRPANFRLLKEGELRARLREIAKRFLQPSAIAIGLAGARTTENRRKLRLAAE